MHKYTEQTMRLSDIFYILIADFPSLFSPISPKPLSFAIKGQLEQYYQGDLSSKHIHYFLGKWTHRTEYYRSVLVYDYRFDLNGQASEIEDKHKIGALKAIQQMSAPPK